MRERGKGYFDLFVHKVGDNSSESETNINSLITSFILEAYHKKFI